MTTFIQIKNGLVSGNVREVDVYAAQENIRTFLNSTAQNYALKINPFGYREIMRATRLLMGEDFKGFIAANYKNGLGPCANLFSTILMYLSGKVSARAVAQSIRSMESIVEYNNKTPNGWTSRTIMSAGKHNNQLHSLDNITNFDYYRLIRGIGVENLSRLFLVILGESHNAR